MIRLKLRRRPGLENVDVLELPDVSPGLNPALAPAAHEPASSSLWGRVTGIFGGKETGVVPHGNQVRAWLEPPPGGEAESREGYCLCPMWRKWKPREKLIQDLPRAPLCGRRR
jgi:hypothetical protein